ncbi:hypothetical protein AMATHDRAFT_145840 [Amanita thiersii Skay4041]|uniref:DASH complex subunit SPC19 n=1 Tax=Amanita thiersii Skay4041 TaxID=703135 RepID=A0A2A9NR39_9AGAR|nr:hypothetical protein AMATHDRAFT_145840 [Amanita thiersii Skay4041]
MSRVSRANFKSRESVFGADPELYRGEIQATCSPYLAECVATLEDCCEEAHEAQQLLRNGTKDLPRMSKVLRNQRVFLLIDEGTVKRYKTELADEVEPQINELIKRSEQGLEALLKKEALLKAKLDNAKVLAPKLARGAQTSSQKLEARRHQMLVRQRQKLEAELKMLESELMSMVRPHSPFTTQSSSVFISF